MLPPHEGDNKNMSGTTKEEDKMDVLFFHIEPSMMNVVSPGIIFLRGRSITNGLTTA
jgi:hypothetical protein